MRKILVMEDEDNIRAFVVLNLKQMCIRDRDRGVRVCCPVGFFRLRQNRGFPRRTIPHKKEPAPLVSERRFFCSVWGHSPSWTCLLYTSRCV